MRNLPLLIFNGCRAFFQGEKAAVYIRFQLLLHLMVNLGSHWCNVLVRQRIFGVKYGAAVDAFASHRIQAPVSQGSNLKVCTRNDTVGVLGLISSCLFKVESRFFNTIPSRSTLLVSGSY